MSTVIRVENVSKQYRLGEVGTGSLAHDVNRWWHRLRGNDDPYLKVGETNDRTSKGSSDYAWALRDVSFEVKQGEVLGIIGRNGAGKSTLLKILSRVTRPTTGEIKVRGRIASLLEVGTGFHPELTGRENIFLNGAILGMRKEEIRRKFAEIVEFSGCERYIDTPVKRYSSGMYVRLAFAVAAHLEPEILIVDEVLAVGDLEFQKKCLGKMKDVAGEGRTVFFVSHNMDAVATLCTRLLLLENGRVTFSGIPVAGIKLYGEATKPLNRVRTGPFADQTVTTEETWVEQANSGGILDVGQALEICVRIHIHERVGGLVLGYRLVSEYGAELIYSLHDDAAPAPVELAPGRYVVRFVIPANTMAAGSYGVRFDLGVHNKRRILQSPNGDLEFVLSNVTGKGRHYLLKHSRGYTSLLRPDWPVRTEKLPD